MTAERIRRGGLAGTRRIQEVGKFKFKKVEYRYFGPDHIRIMSTFVQAKETPEEDQEVVLFPADPALKRQRLTLNLMQLRTLLSRMDKAAKRMAKARYLEMETPS